MYDQKYKVGTKLKLKKFVTQNTLVMYGVSKQFHKNLFKGKLKVIQYIGFELIKVTDKIALPENLLEKR